MNTCVMDRQIAHKAKAGGQKLISNIERTKAKVRKEIDKGKEAGSKTTSRMFPASNKSAIAAMPISSRKTQFHPGKGSHIPWRLQAFCQYCNKGVASKCEQGKLNIYHNSHPSRLQIGTAPRLRHLSQEQEQWIDVYAM